MFDDRRQLESLPVTTRFEFAVRHCSKCGWTGPVVETTLRYCGPAQRVEGDWAEMFLFGEAAPPPCEGGGEHFHWQCAVCRYRRVLPMPGPGIPGAN